MRLLVQNACKSRRGGRNADQSGWFAIDCSSDRHRSAERKPGKPQGPSRSFLAHPVDSGEHVTDFPFPIVKATFALSDASEIEAQSRNTDAGEAPCERVRDFVLHRATMHRMWMTYDSQSNGFDVLG